MSSGQTSSHADVLRECPACQALFYPDANTDPEKVACPECGKLLNPTAKQQAAAAVAQVARQEDVPELKLREATSPAAPVEYLTMVCPTCLTRLHATADRLGEKLMCPDCYTRVVVKRPEALSEYKKERQAREQEYRLGSEDGPALGADHYLSFRCPKCDTKLTVRKNQVGQRVACDECGTKLLVPVPLPPKEKPKQRPIESYVVSEAEAPVLLAADFFLVSCPICNARMHPRRDEAGQQIACPDCFTKITVPTPPPLSKKKPLPKVDEYNVADPDANTAPAEIYFAVNCPRCSTRLTPRRVQAGKKMTCPDCQERFVIPQPPPPKVKIDYGKSEEMVVGPAIEPPPPMLPPVQARAIEERIPLPPPPARAAERRV